MQVVYGVLLLLGAIVYRLTKRTPTWSQISLRQLFCATNGRTNDALSALLSRLHPPESTGVVEGVLGRLDDAALARITREIEAQGFYVFEARVDSATCQRIVEFARSVPARMTPPPSTGSAFARYDSSNVLATRYDFEEQELLRSPDVQALTVDSSVMAVAQAYLRCNPVQDLTAMWWTAPFGSTPSSEAAQMFHFDMDRVKFLKFFMYMSDVTASTGPHCYVRDSHVRKPKALRRDERIADAEMAQHYAPESIVDIEGPVGTIFAADTRGFHKGTLPVRGDRLVVQLEYANSLFGAPFESQFDERVWTPAARAAIARSRYTFQRFGV